MQTKFLIVFVLLVVTIFVGQSSTKGTNVEALRFGNQFNLDERIYAENMIKFAEDFSFFDKDSDGLIDINELDTLMKSVDESLTEAELKVIIYQNDHDESGTIDFSEYIVILYRIITNPYSEGKGSMQEEFSFLDQDGNGFISVDDYRNAMAILAEKLKGVKVNIEGASYFFSKGDSDGDGQLNYEEFVLIKSYYYKFLQLLLKKDRETSENVFLSRPWVKKGERKGMAFTDHTSNV